MTTPNLSEQEIIRREKLAELKQLGIDAFPAPLYPVNTTAAYIREHYPGRREMRFCRCLCRRPAHEPPGYG